MIHVTRLSLLAALGIAFVGLAGAADKNIPPTPRGDVADVIQGVKVADPYRWLEDADDPKVQTWSDAQNTRTRTYLDAVPARARLKSKLTELITATSSAYGGLTMRGGKLFAVFNDPSKQQPMIVVMDPSADPSTQKIVLDPNTFDAKGGTAFDWFEPSPDGKLLAVSLSLNGSEDGDLHIFDVATGKEIDKPIQHVQYPTAGGSMAWAPDGKGFWYTRFPGKERAEADRHFFQQVHYHKVGAASVEDPVVLGDKDGLPRVAEIVLDNRYSPAATLASVQLGDGGKYAHWVLRGDGSKTKLSGFDDGVVAATIGPDNAIYLLSRAGAPKGKILKVPLAEPILAKAKEIVPEGDAAIVSDSWQRSLVVTKDRLFVRDIVGGPSQVRMLALDGKPQGTLLLPELVAVHEMEALSNGDVLYDVTGYLHPRYFARWIAATGKSEETKLKVTSPITFDDVEVSREFATSKDGTKVPVTVARKKGTKLDGSNPTLLYGYGGYGVNQTPGFLGARWRLWLDGGGIYAEANIRGGGEYGEAWHLQGNLTKKQNVFDDFAAAGQMLIARKFTSTAKLAMMGGSNGGLLMGAMITQHPDLVHAVVSSVGIYDMLRVELDPNGEFNVQEFGTVKDPAQFKALYAYSPYHNVKAGTKYPAVMMLTGANDGRVNPMQSRKFTAALQEATASSAPIILRTSKTSGHGQGSALSERIDQQADTLAFLYDQFGIK